ncbi:hypothetical protein M5K25_020239 [Dendrobium thyrsiflorum]|uniref:Uncharacterized protein n=1 Tax=Dendrobium thyrsiflorum TaxID=117978 RepID=A0ABD0U9D6_DENTH
MANRRSNRILGASRSNTHQSGNQSMNHGRQVSASFRPGGQHVVGEGTSGPSLEERIRKMEESQNEILQLLRETRQPALAPQEEVLLPQDPLGMDDVQLDHLHAEIPLPPLRRHPQSRQDDELADTASSTHPSYIGRQPRIPPDLPEDLAQPHVAELPRNTLRHELRRLILLIHISAQIAHLVVEVVKIREIKHLQQILFPGGRVKRPHTGAPNGAPLPCPRAGAGCAAGGARRRLAAGRRPAGLAAQPCPGPDFRPGRSDSDVFGVPGTIFRRSGSNFDTFEAQWSFYDQGPKAREEGEKKRRGEGRSSSSTTAGVSPSEFRRTAT